MKKLKYRVTTLTLAALTVATLALTGCASSPYSDGHLDYRGVPGIDNHKLGQIVHGRIQFVGEYTNCVEPDICKKAAYADALTYAAKSIHDKVKALVEEAVTARADNSLPAKLRRSVLAGTTQFASAEIQGARVEFFYHRFYHAKSPIDNSDMGKVRDEICLISLSQADYNHAVAVTLAAVAPSITKDKKTLSLLNDMENRLKENLNTTNE